MKNIRNILKDNEYLMIIIIFIIAILLIISVPNLDNSFIKADKLYISEIMPYNTYTYLDDDNEYSDYIEIYNGYSYEINLKGYHLSDSEFETSKWTFPSVVIKPKEYLIVFASGKDKCDLESRICHTNFKLSSKGEVLTLTDKSGNIINKFTFPKTVNDMTYGYTGFKYAKLNEPTPLYKNSGKYKYQKLSNEDIYINEYMSHNQRNNYDPLGNYSDFVEIYNNSNKNIELSNIYLSDDINELDKYKLPKVVINKNDYLLVYLGEESLIVDNQITASFKLSDTDKYLVISNGKKIIDKVDLVKLSDNISYGRKEDRWYYFTKPTPGKANDTVFFESLGGINERS